MIEIAKVPPYPPLAIILGPGFSVSPQRVGSVFAIDIQIQFDHFFRTVKSNKPIARTHQQRKRQLCAQQWPSVLRILVPSLLFVHCPTREPVRLPVPSSSIRRSRTIARCQLAASATRAVSLFVPSPWCPPRGTLDPHSHWALLSRWGKKIKKLSLSVLC